MTPTFFINGRRYSGTWDESSLADAMLGPLGHRIQSAALDFVRWGPSSGLLLGLATVIVLVLSNSPVSSEFAAWWETLLGFQFGTFTFVLSLLDWVNHGLLTIFFIVVGLEIKREFTVGHLASIRSGALPVIAALGGIVLPAVIYALIAPPHLRHGWGIPIGTDTAFAVALIVLLGSRVPIELRVFLEDRHTGEAMRAGPSEPALSALDAIHARIESPAEKLLRSVEPWSSYLVLPIFALANAGVAWSVDVFQEHGRLMCAIVLGLVVGKSTGIVAAAWLAVRSGIAVKPEAYSWRQLVGAGALGGIGFTMSLFIAGEAFPNPADYAAAKIAIFIASLIAAMLGTIILYPRRHEDGVAEADETSAVRSAM